MTMQLAAEVLGIARERQLRIATAESCTGGMIAAALTDIPGSSAVFERGFVTYSNESKQELLGVPAELIAAHGAVSGEVAQAMAEGVLRHSRADLAVSITGIAGPEGGSVEKPVGLVFLAVVRRPSVVIPAQAGISGRTRETPAFAGVTAEGGVVVECYHFPGDRASVRQAAMEAALNLLMAQLSP